jgi:ketosteroid isomerase-like protein
MRDLSGFSSISRLALFFLILTMCSSLLHPQTLAKNGDGGAAVHEADMAFAQATKQSGLDGWMSYFADDAYLGTNPAVRGKLELRRFYTNLFSRRDLKFEWTPDHAEIFKSGILGYTSGRYTMSFTNFQGATVSQTGSYVTIWQKQPDGSWKVLSDFGSQDKPEAAPKADAEKPEAQPKQD